MKLKQLLALLMALGLIAAACGGSDSEGESSDTTAAADDGGSDDGGSDDGGSDDGGSDDGGDDGGDDAMADGELKTDFGVTETEIRVGLNADLSGPFAALVAEIVEAQTVYWEMVNDNGGIAGRQVVPVILDSGYATDKGIENYLELAQESEEGVVMISENTGSPITAAIVEDATDDDMLVIPLSWASLWPAEQNILGKQTTYCAESMNGVSWLQKKVEADGQEAKLAIISRPGEYGEDGHVGAELAAEALGIEIVYNGKGEVAGDDRTAVISQLVGSGATMVWTTLTPGELADIFGNAVAQGFEATWSGNGPSFSYPVLLASDLAPAFDQYYWQSGYNVPWAGNDSEGMNEMVTEMTDRRPDAVLSDQYTTGWIEGIIVQTILEQAAANGDMTRAGVVQAAEDVGVIDLKGLAPAQAFFGTYDEIVVRESYIFDVDATAFDLQPLSAGAGSSGLIVEEGPFVADVTAGYEFGGPCI